MIIIKNLYIYPESRSHLLLCIDEQIFDENSIWFIQGPSGSGKTLLLKTLSRNYNHYSGNIIIDNAAIEYIPQENLRKKIQYLDQHYPLFEHMTIYDQLKNLLIKVVKKDPHDVDWIIDEHLDQLYLLDHAKKYPWQLSGGQRQRIALIQKVMINPEYLFLDEPTSALDAHSKDAVLQYISKFQKTGKTILMSTHDKETYSFFEEKKIFTIQNIAK
jgi:ABC-type polar amino acid transport system ATPase subunit